MKVKLLTLILAVASVGSLFAQTEHKLSVDCGEDIVICPDKCYAFFCSGSADTLYLGKNVKITGGVAPYTYAWSCKPQEQRLKMISASNLLSDTTIVNPYFKWSPSEYYFPIFLKVTDSEGNIATDSLSLLWESFIYLADGNDNMVRQADGNSIYLTGEQRDMSCMFPPMSYFAVIGADTIALPAFVTVQESDSVTIFGIDSIGCHDYPRKVLGKWLMVSVDETDVEVDVVKVVSNALVFSDNSEKQIHLYSTNGQLLYSKSTTGTMFDIPMFKNVSHYICSVIVNNKHYSFHLIRP